MRRVMLRKAAGVCGVMSQPVGLVALLLAASRYPAFGWRGSDISVLGVEGPTAAVFNWGLIISGLLSLAFAIGLGRSTRWRRPGRWGIASLLLGSIALSGIGIFPRTLSLPHSLVAIGFFTFVTLALLLIGIAAAVASRIKWALLSLTAAAATIAFIAVPWPWEGGAIPQLLLCIPWSLWTVVFAIELLASRPPAA